MKRIIFSIILIIFTGTFIFNCSKKDENNPTNPPTDSSEYQAVAKVAVGVSDCNGTSNYANSSATLSGVSAKIVGDTTLPYFDCPTVKVNKATKTITLDFGQSGCTAKDGITRYGSISMSITAGGGTGIGGALAKGDSIALSLQFNNYKVSTTQYSGAMSYKLKITDVTHLPETRKGEMSYKLTNGVIKYANGDSSKINLTINGTFDSKTWVQPYDNEYKISGNGNFTDISGNNYTVSIDANNPLVYTLNCQYPYPKSGKMTVSGKFNGKDITAVIDFGTGTCDSKASITINGVTKEYDFSTGTIQ